MAKRESRFSYVVSGDGPEGFREVSPDLASLRSAKRLARHWKGMGVSGLQICKSSDKPYFRRVLKPIGRKGGRP